MIQFESLNVYQIEPSSTTILWAFRLTNEDLTGLVVDVFRSYSPTDAFEKVGQVEYPQRYFKDDHPGTFDNWRRAYYKLTAVYQGRTLEIGPSTINSELSVLAKEMVRRKNLELRFNGIPVMIYLKRKGERCTTCWDPVLKKATNSRCTMCYGTGFTGGFYEPILTCANFIPEDKTDQADVTKRQDAQTSLSMSAFPMLRPEDIIYEMNDGKRWRVVRITPVEIDRLLVGQEPVIVARLNSTDVEHKLPIPEGLDYVIKPHWHFHIKKPYDKVIHREDEGETVEKMDLWR